MKQVTTLSIVLALVLAFSSQRISAQINPMTLTIQQVQQVHPDTLAAGYAVGTTTAIERCQYSPYLGDTVRITGTVIASPRISPGGPLLFALGNANTMYIMDENGGAWSGINVRATDSVASASTLITAVDTGFVVRITGVVTQYFSTTQFEVGKVTAWNADVQVEVLDTKPRRPAPTEIKITDLVNGDPKTSIVSSQQWEGVYAVIKGVSVGTVSKNGSTGRYTWTVTDGTNSIGVYDQSVYFRGGTQGFDPNWAPPAPGTQLTAIRGIITSSGQGIVIAPMYPGDITLGSFPPIIKNVQRSIAIPNSAQSVTVNAEVEDSNTGGSIQEVSLTYGTGANAIATLTMTYNAAAKTASVDIPANSDGSVIWYYLTAKDNSNETAQFPTDITKSKPFYIVRDGNTRIRDIQYTPFTDGLPGCVGATVTTRGIVCADTSGLGLVYIQDAADPWCGIMVRGDAGIRGLKIGDDVTVTGKVAEGYSSATNGNTVIMDATLTTNNGTATPYAPVDLTTGVFKTESVPDGTPSAEQWEGMLVTFRNLTVSGSNADEYQGRNFGEFLVDDGSGSLRVDDFGLWRLTYTNDSTKTSLIYLKKGTRIGQLTGIMFFNFANYKLEPRNAADFNSVTDVTFTPSTPDRFALGQLYPNPVSQSMHAGATLRFDIPQSALVSVKVYDGLGREVATIADGQHNAGTYMATINTRVLAGGAYFVRLVSAGFTSVSTLIVGR